MRTLLALAILVTHALADDCAQCSPEKICQKHADEDKAAIQSFKKGITNPDPGVRKAALEGFKAACDQHANCRPPGNAGIVGLALKDPDFDVRIRAVEILAESQDPRTAGKLLDPLVNPLVKNLWREPKPGRDETLWNNELALIKSIIKALGQLGVPEAGPPMAKVLASMRLVVLEAASEHVHLVKCKEVPPALIQAIDNVRATAVSEKRDRAFIGLLRAWERLTSSGVPELVPGDAADANRFVSDCRKWWKANEKAWK